MPNMNMPNYYYPNYQIQNNVPQAQPQIQNGGFVSVRSESEARNYPIAIGTSVTFKDENAPYIYNKTMGFSQLEAPRFDKYRLVKETVEETPSASGNEDVTASVDGLKTEIEAIWKEIEVLKKKPVPKVVKKKEEEDE